MKYWKKIILPAGILVVMVIALALSGKLGIGTAAPTTTANPVEFLFYADENAVDTITVKNDSATMVLDRTEKTAADGMKSTVWEMRSPANPAYSADMLSTFTTTLRSVSTVRLITESATNLETYGLAKPTATLTIKQADGSIVEIYLGNKAGSGNNYYAMLKGASKVYTITTSIGEAMLSSPMALLDPTLCSVAYNDIKTFSLSRTSDGLSVTMVSSPFYDDTGKMVELQWRFSLPVIWKADTLSVSPVVDEVLAAKADTFVAMDVTDYSKYGLDRPVYEFKITDANQTYTIKIGKSAGTGLVYGMSSRIPGAVFTTLSSGFTKTDAPIIQWLDRFVYLGGIDKVVHLDLAFDDKKLAIEIDGVTEPNVFKINGKDANIVDSSEKNYFKSFYQSIIGTTISGLDATAKPALTNPVVTIKYTLREGDPVSVAFVKRDAYTLYAFLDGVYTGGYVDINILDSMDYGVGNILPTGLRPSYAGLVNAMEKAVDGVYN